MSVFEDFKKDVLAILTNRAPVSFGSRSLDDDSSKQVNIIEDQSKLPSGAVITSPMGKRIHPVTGKESEHMGIDISGIGTAPVYAVADAVVIASYFGKSGGNTIVLSYKIGNDTIKVTYMHLSQIDVKKGDFVRNGQKIGNIGKTGSMVTGVHLHLEYSVNDVKRPAPMHIIQAAIKHKITSKDK